MRRLSWRLGVRELGITGSYCYCLHPSVRQDLRRFWVSRIHRQSRWKQFICSLIITKLYLENVAKNPWNWGMLATNCTVQWKTERLSRCTRERCSLPHMTKYIRCGCNKTHNIKSINLLQGKELSLALANRSAVLFKIGEIKWVHNYAICYSIWIKLLLLSLYNFRLALRDIDLSLDAGYPMDLTFKLQERRFKCYKELRQMKNAISSAEV